MSAHAGRPRQRVLALCLLVAVTAACGEATPTEPVGTAEPGQSGESSEGSSGDGPLYESVEALTAAAEVVVLGSVAEVRGTEVDDGGNDDGRGVEITFRSVVVDEVLSGRATTVQAGDTLAVGTSEREEALSEGDEMVLFLEELTPAEAPGIDTEAVFYVIIGTAGNGAFDVQDAAVIARSDQVRGLGAATAGPSDEPFTTSIPDLRTYFTDR